MANYEVVHIAIAPPAILDENLVRSVAAIINKHPYDTRLLLAGEIPRIIAHCDSMQIAESIIQKLKDLGLVAIACRDLELRQSPQSFKAQTLEFRENGVLFRDSGGREKIMGEDNVFLILEGRVKTSEEVETTKSKTKFSLTTTLLTGGFPVWRKVNEKTTTRSIQTQYFVRLYDRKSSDPGIELLQNNMNYSFLGANIAISSPTNFTAVVTKLRDAFPQAIFDSRLTKPFLVTTSSNRVWENTEVNCKLIYLFHLVTSGLNSIT